MATAMRALLVAAALLVPAAASAQPGGGVEDVDRAFKAWMARHKVDRGTLAVAYRDRLVLTAGHGGWRPEVPGLVASLSKAITGVCLGTLVDAGKTAFDARIGDVLAEHFRAHGEPADPRIKAATLGQALVHRAGFARSSENADPVDVYAFLRARTARETQIEPLLKATLEKRLPAAPGEAYRYSNAAYLLLGAAIERVSGRPYEAYCTDAVLKPLRITGATLHPTWRILSSFGGWSLSGPQYLVFLRAFDPDSKILGSASRRFLAAADGKGMGASAGAYYSLGVNTRAQPDGRVTVWHAGRWRAGGGTYYDGPLTESVGTYAVRYASRISWFASYAPVPAEGASAELDRDMARAIAAVATWPSTDGFAALGLR